MGIKNHPDDIQTPFIRDYFYFVRGTNYVKARVYVNEKEITSFMENKEQIKRGIYIAIAEEGTLFTPIYIGKSMNINSRMRMHKALRWQYLIVFDIDEMYYTHQEMLCCESNLMLLAAISNQFLPLNRSLSTEVLNNDCHLFSSIVRWLTENNFDFLDLHGCFYREDGVDYTEKDLVGINIGQKKHEVLKYGTVTLRFFFNDDGSVVVLPSSKLTALYHYADSSSWITNSHVKTKASLYRAHYDINRSKTGKFHFGKTMTFNSLSAAMSIATLDDFPDDFSWFSYIWHPLKRTKFDKTKINQSQAIEYFCTNWESSLDLESLLNCPVCYGPEKDALKLFRH